MEVLFDNMFRRLPITRATFKDWIQKLAHHPGAVWFLGIFAFLESIIIPIPTDMLLAPLVGLRPRSWFRLALVTTISSLLGGVVAYLLGALFFDIFGNVIATWNGGADNFLRVQTLFDQNTFWAMLVSAVTFIPYKLVALFGGVFHVSFPLFVLGSTVGRSLRFFLEAYVMKRFGYHAMKVTYRYLNVTVIALLVLVGIILFFLLRH